MYFGVLIGIGNHITMKSKFLRGAFIHQKDEPWSNWPAAGKMSSSNVHRCASNDSIPFADHWNSFGNAHTFPVCCDSLRKADVWMEAYGNLKNQNIMVVGTLIVPHLNIDNVQNRKKIRKWIIIASCSCCCCCCCCSCYCCCCCIKSSEPLLCLFFV